MTILLLFLAQISTTMKSLFVGHTRREILNVAAVVLIMPMGSQLPNMEQPKYANRFYRDAKKAYVNGHKCWMFVIEVGNGEFSDLLPGLQNLFVAYSYYVGQIATKKPDADDRFFNGVNDIFPTHLYLTGYSQEQPNSPWGTFAGKSYVLPFA